MRRFWLALLAFLGAACITAAIAIPLFLVPMLRVVPLNLDITSVSSTVPEDGSNGERFPARIFDRCSINAAHAQVLDAHLTQQRRTLIVQPSDRRQATVQSAQTVQVDRTRDAAGKETVPTMAAADAQRKCDDGLLDASIDRVSVNRKTAVPNGTVSSLQLEAAPQGVNVKDVSVDLPDRKGFQYKFGFDVRKRSYLYYDTVIRQDTPVKFTGEKTIDGLTTYEFVGDSPETDLSSLPNAQGEAALGTMLTMPAKWWGISGAGVKPNDSVTMHRYATATRHIWVEPATGTIVDAVEDQHQYFKSPDQSDDTPAPIRNFTVDVLKGRFQWAQQTTAYQVNKANGYRSELRLGEFWLPLILGIVGVVLLALWALLLWRARRRGDDEPVGTDPAATGWLAEQPRDDGVRTEAVPAGETEQLVQQDGRHNVAATEAPTETHRPVVDHSALDPWDRPTEQIPIIHDDEPNPNITRHSRPEE